MNGKLLLASSNHKTSAYLDKWDDLLKFALQKRNRIWQKDAKYAEKDR